MTVSTTVPQSRPARRPRVLFLSFRVHYVNPTRQNYAHVLRRACDVMTFGPGYSSLEEVRAGPEAFVATHGPFDAVVVDEYALLRDEIPDDKKHLHQFLNHACDFDPLLIHEGTRYYQYLKTFRGPRIVSLLASDYYNLADDFVEQMEEVGDYFACWGPEFILPKALVPYDSVAGQPLNNAIHLRWNDNYFEFLRRNRSRVISTPHFIAESEFCDRRLALRRYGWSVLGADYGARINARALIDAKGNGRSGRLLPYLIRAAEKAGLHLYNKFWALDLLNTLFNRAIRASRFSYTCGSALRWPIRKYFEIPANGAVLVAERCEGFEALGFRDRRNAVIAENGQIEDADAWLSEDLERAQKVADAGRELIRACHSVAARADQFAAALDRILAGTFAGSVWDSGEFRLLEPASGKIGANAAQLERN